MLMKCIVNEPQVMASQMKLPLLRGSACTCASLTNRLVTRVIPGVCRLQCLLCMHCNQVTFPQPEVYWSGRLESML